MEVTGGMNCSSCSYPASVRISVWFSIFDGCFQRLVPVLAINTGRRVRFYSGYQIRRRIAEFLKQQRMI